MCPFCIGTALWIAAGAVSTGGVSALAVFSFRDKRRQFFNKKARERDQQGESQNA